MMAALVFNFIFYLKSYCAEPHIDLQEYNLIRNLSLKSFQM